MTFLINLKDANDAEKLVRTLEADDYDWDLNSGHFIVDGKSFLGVCSSAIGRSAELTTNATLSNEEVEQYKKKLQFCLVESK